MAESDPVKSAGPDASAPEAQPASSGDGISATVAPDDDDSVAMTDWSAGQVILDDFVIVRELGAGGMGKVYLLRSRSTGQPFAVKRAFLRNEDSRRQFLAELRTWIDLPEHPHLVACRFFRTVGDEVVIFAEFVEGGSLTDWIRDRRLTRLEQILDAAIQFAWGLHAAHELGLVHQDVKPGNALMTRDGLVKVADFGLARGRVVAAVGANAERQRPDVTSYAGTPAYQSPEQAAGERLTAATDVWSWGLAVLETFRGERFWTTGVAAPEALKAYLKRPADDELPAMPNNVAEVLEKCFRRDPAERWATLAEAAQALQSAYEEGVGKQYPRQMPVVLHTTQGAVAGRPPGTVLRSGITVIFNWGKFLVEGWPIKLESVQNPTELGRCFLPWYVNKAGTEVAYDHPDGRPIRLAEVSAHRASLRTDHQAGIANKEALLRSCFEPTCFPAPVYALPGGGCVVMDRCHRLAALMLVGLPFRVTLCTVQGPAEENCLADLKGLGRWA